MSDDPDQLPPRPRPYYLPDASLLAVYEAIAKAGSEPAAARRIATTRVAMLRAKLEGQADGPA